MKRLLVVWGLFIIPFGVFSQEWEIGTMAGPTAYDGDVIYYPLEFEDLRPGFGTFVRYNINQSLTLKANVHYGHIAGDDANSESNWQKRRNLSFRTQIMEAGAQLEWNLFGFSTMDKNNNFSPYGLIGISVFNFKPETEYNGEWVELQPLGTEGQGSDEYSDRQKYNLTQISIPFGGGVKYALNKNWSIGLEAGLRKTFTDYLDDVSKTYVESEVLRENSGDLAAQVADRSENNSFSGGDVRGSPSAKDWYAFTGLTISYTIVPDKCYNFQ